jgi:hypothetical protein
MRNLLKEGNWQALAIRIFWSIWNSIVWARHEKSPEVDGRDRSDDTHAHHATDKHYSCFT